MRKNFFTKLITVFTFSLLVGLTACNREDVNYETPVLKLDKTQLNFDAEGNSIDGVSSFTIETNRNWTITIPDTAKEWIRFSSESGDGNATIEVTVLANSEDRTARIKISSTINYEYIDIVQSSGVVPVSAIYSENVGILVEKVNNQWPFVDQFIGWFKAGDLSQDGVTYSGQGANVSNSGAAFEPENGSSISGAPYIGMSYSAANPTRYFVIEKINVTGKRNLTFKFASLFQSGYSGGPQFGEITPQTFELSGSLNGTEWTVLNYSTQKDPAGGNWYLSTSEFNIPEGTSELYIKIAISSLVASQGTRLDDFALYEGGNGTTEIGGNVPTTTSVSTTSASNITISSANVGGTYTLATGVTFDEVGISYKKSSDTDFINVPASNVSTPFTVSLTDLGSGIEYTYKAYAKVGENYTYGSEVKFKTSEEVTPPTPGTVQILFKGSDFENWTDFLSSLNSYGLQSYASQSTDGRNNSNGALYLNGTPKGNDYIFTASLSDDITIASPSKIIFYIKGNSAKSLSLNVYRNDGKSYDVFNLENYTNENTPLTKAELNSSGNGTNSYVGTINTQGVWMKVTLNIANVDINKVGGNTIFALKVGKGAAYDLLIDDITIE